MQRTFYFVEPKSKLRELYNILHIPFTLMCLSFVAAGVLLYKPVDPVILAGSLIAYFFGLGIGAHALDQTSEIGSRYVTHLTKKELLFLTAVSLAIAIALGIYATLKYHLTYLPVFIALEGLFAVGYPKGEWFGGKLHNDISFSISFGFLPVLCGYYVASHHLSLQSIVLALIASVASHIEITISRYVRKIRKELRSGFLTLGSTKISVDNVEFVYSKFVERPERALKLVCILSYLLPFFTFLVR